MLQDCGKPWYVENYIAFFAAIRARYPQMRLISNCDMDPHAPTDLFDWHLYTDTQNMFDRRHEFDTIPNIQDKKVFASEYAVFDEPAGHNIQFPGNLKVSFGVHSSFALLGTCLALVAGADFLEKLHVCMSLCIITIAVLE